MQWRREEPEVRRALDVIVRDSLQEAMPYLAALLGFFALADLFTTPPEHAARVALADAVVAVAFLGGHLLLRRGIATPRHAHLVGASVALLVTLDILHDTLTLQDPEQATYLMVVLLGCGALFLSYAYATATVAAIFAVFLAAVFVTPGPRWDTFVLAVVASSTLALLVHHVRYRELRHFHMLRVADAKRKEELEIRGEALTGAMTALQESEDRYRQLVEQAPDAFLVFADGHVVYVNAAGVRLFGATRPEDLVGRDTFSLLHPEDAALARRRVAQIIEEGRPTQPAEMRIVRLDGSLVEVEAVGHPIMYMGRRADQTILRDLTDRKRAESERTVAAQRLAEIARLREIDRVKTQFVNTISHELRTPLTPIKVQLHLLKSAEHSPEKHRRAIDVLERNVQRLAALVDELLEVARIQAGTLKISRAYVDLSETIAHGLESHIDVARQNVVQLDSRIEPGIVVQGDAKRLGQVLDNLLGNAFKFTPVGGHIAVEVRSLGDKAVVRVTDDGAGLRPEDIAKLFEPFSQVHDPMQKTHAGTGLGLYICRGFIEGHGGRIWCESEGPGKGATFSFELPLHARRDAAEAAAPEPPT